MTKKLKKWIGATIGIVTVCLSVSFSVLSCSSSNAQTATSVNAINTAVDKANTSNENVSNPIQNWKSVFAQQETTNFSFLVSTSIKALLLDYVATLNNRFLQWQQELADSGKNSYSVSYHATLSNFQINSNIQNKTFALSYSIFIQGLMNFASQTGPSENVHMNLALTENVSLKNASIAPILVMNQFFQPTDKDSTVSGAVYGGFYVQNSIESFNYLLQQNETVNGVNKSNGQPNRNLTYNNEVFHSTLNSENTVAQLATPVYINIEQFTGEETSNSSSSQDLHQENLVTIDTWKTNKYDNVKNYKVAVLTNQLFVYPMHMQQNKKRIFSDEKDF